MRQQTARRKNNLLACSLVAAQLLITGCAAPADVHTASPAAAITEPAAGLKPSAPARVLSASPAASTTPERTPIVATSPAMPAPTNTLSVCSPLEDITLDELRQPDLLKNPFQMPRPGMDDGHHGADFAYWTRGTHTSMQGLPVHSVLSGKVAGVIYNRLPYGNAIIIETPLDSLPPDYLRTLPVPTLQPTVTPDASLYCPSDRRAYGDPSRRSLYLLYAHLDQPPALAPGDVIGCGDIIGQVGTTGKSVNYHLHLEVRAGPSGNTFPSFAHYDTAATEEEMSAYCTWRVSGLFQMFDPLVLFPLSGQSLQP